VKELTALHSAARLLQDMSRDLDEVMPAVAGLLPAAWQYPADTEAQIRWGDRRWATPSFVPTPWSQTETLRMRDGQSAELSVVYRSEHPPADEGPFLAEERELIRSLAELIRAHLQHRLDDAAIVVTNERLELQVAERTAALRRLTREVSLAEERERRRIAEDLHDHLGQVLVLMKMRLKKLRGDSALGGHDRALDELVELSDQAIRYTRGLTFDLSPPVLYELGLGPAIDWLGEQVQKKHGIHVRVEVEGSAPVPDELRVVLWKCVRELIHNVVKHARATSLEASVSTESEWVRVQIADDGQGFDHGAVRAGSEDHFGLFSIEERLRDYGGSMLIDSAPGRGTRIMLEARIPEIER
jgi:signal transduction histidine kinase